MDIVEICAHHLKHRHPEWSDEQLKINVKNFFNQLTEEELLSLPYNWKFMGRLDQQISIDNHPITLMHPGRGWGKNQTVSSIILNKVRYEGYRSILLGNRSYSDVVKYQIEGESGLLNQMTPEEASTLRFDTRANMYKWDIYDAKFYIMSGKRGEQARGGNHDLTWLDEIAAWEVPQAIHNAIIATRIGSKPRTILTFTPEPREHIKQLVKQPGTQIIKGTTFDNYLLSPDYIAGLLIAYPEGTRLYRQELLGELLEDVDEAVFKYENIVQNRIMPKGRDIKNSDAPEQTLQELKNEIRKECSTVIITVDPDGSKAKQSLYKPDPNYPHKKSMTGIMVLGIDKRTMTGYVLEDATISGGADVWGKKVIELYRTWAADYIVAETNYGGDMVRATINSYDQWARVETVHAREGKYARAEPINSLLINGRIKFVGEFKMLEDQMITWVKDVSKWSPDRMDSMVHGFTKLFDLDNKKPPRRTWFKMA